MVQDKTWLRRLTACKARKHNAVLRQKHPVPSGVASKNAHNCVANLGKDLGHYLRSAPGCEHFGQQLSIFRDGSEALSEARRGGKPDRPKCFRWIPPLRSTTPRITYSNSTCTSAFVNYSGSADIWSGQPDYRPQNLPGIQLCGDHKFIDNQSITYVEQG